MTVKNMTWVFENSPYTLGARLIHLALADSANDSYQSLVWESQGVIAKKAGVSRATVNATLQKMVNDGWLDEVNGDEIPSFLGVSKSKVYRFRTCQKSDTSEDATCQVDASLPVKSGGGIPICIPRVNPSDLKQGMDPLLGFDHFWSAYPERHGKKLGKGKCQQRWVKIALADRRNAFRGAVNYAKAVADHLTIAKDPERYLRDRVWEDWQIPATPQVPSRQVDEYATERARH